MSFLRLVMVRYARRAGGVVMPWISFSATHHPGDLMKPWHISVVVVVLLLVVFVGWLVASYRRGRDGR
ncbi:hypothetical protein [Actinoplanes sp. TFC3]|uniref:hypothetical protein n=1 Tax=Actinoplanes sp. TFC3 TaxID=1710355 RepID=UPI000AFFD393|nr:hypothetical protein [Actinoplanes sp. TFC3]